MAAAKRVYLPSILSLNSDPELVVEGIDAIFEAAATNDQFALVIFPEIESIDELVKLVTALAAHNRWTCRRVHCESQDLLSIELLWSIRTGLLANAVGFGPFSCMPPTRRAPLLCLGVWPKEASNPFMDYTAGSDVGLAHSGHGLNQGKYGSAWTKTIKETKVISEAFGMPSPALLRRTTFRVPIQYADVLGLPPQ